MTQETSDNEGVIAEIGNEQLTADDLLSFLIATERWNLVDEFLDYELTRNLIEKHQIEVGQEELREHLTVYRERHRLLTGSDMHAFLAKHHIPEDEFLERCNFEIALEKLKEAMFKDKIDEYFAFRRLELNKVELYKIAVHSEDAAKEIIDSLRDGSSFFELSHRYSFDEETRKVCGYIGLVTVNTLDPKLQELLAGRPTGTVVGPVKVGREYLILLVGESHPAMFDGETRALLLDELYKQSLIQMRERGGVRTLI